ncbi:mucin-13 [Mesoplodon densirostris]|uniref:mucin-13 n=1 Tax=Mesoplodon densirostris TaxID=48708 RepID=UPI0028DC7CF5|nr:mucin-13 [Mesoplodon densirostris]
MNDWLSPALFKVKSQILSSRGFQTQAGIRTATTTSAPAPDAGPGSPSTATTTSAPAPDAGPGSPSTATTTSAPAPDAGPASPSTATTTSAPAPDAGPGSPSTATTTNAPAPDAGPASPSTATTTNAPAPDAGPGSPSTATTTSAPAPDAGPTTPTNNNNTCAPNSTTGPATPTTNTSTPTPSTNIPGSSTPDQVDPCKDGSSFVKLHVRHFCLCSEGYYYNSSTCNKGKIFPGMITVRISSTSDLENKSSVAYEGLYLNITGFFKNVFKNSDYGQTIIEKLSTSPSARSAMHTVDVAVVNIFTETTKQTEENISRTIEKALAQNATEFTGYIEQDRCDYYGCKKNEQDDCTNGLQCQCKPGLLRLKPQIPLCVALGPKCPDDCTTEKNKQCLVKNSENATCVCLPGYKEDNHEICKPCAFGYSGVDCKDSFQLILTIVGTIAGILILGMVIAFIFSVRSKNKSRNVEEENLIVNDFQNLKLQESGFSNLGADGSIFPKIRVNLHKESQPQNPYVVQGVYLFGFTETASSASPRGNTRRCLRPSGERGFGRTRLPRHDSPLPAPDPLSLLKSSNPKYNLGSSVERAPPPSRRC